MKITKAKFIISAPSIKECPVLNLPEFALLGRSNVGKSSFINAFVNIKGLAKTSNTPGKTRLINLFNINDLFIFADLPGYGYAKTPRAIQNQWQKNLEQYLLNRKSLASLIQIVDSRHPLQKNDLQMAQWIKYHSLPCFIIASKADLISKSQISNTIRNFENELNLKVFPFSKTNSYYNQKIADYIEEIIKYL